ncbi:MAG: hypothetical protein ACD_44C00033G0013 [uncultured bacterium]|nr:MAG: hypothetical protein ACD_44C00033G0013 [uncultured bacterium]
MTDEFVILGKISQVHGIKGGVKVYSFTSPKTQILNYQPWYVKLKETWTPLTIQSTQVHGQYLLVYFENYHERDQAQLLQGAEIAIKSDQLPPLPPHEYYWKDLINLTVVNLEGITLGRVERLMETGSNDVLIVKNNKKEYLIPYLPKRFVKNIDLKTKKILVDWDPDF